jgi:CarD family transcriptional regulator, regulator of rRNA transcription
MHFVDIGSLFSATPPPTYRWHEIGATVPSPTSFPILITNPQLPDCLSVPNRIKWVGVVPLCALRPLVVLMLNGDGSFHIGDKVVYPNHGVGIIEQISSRTIGESVEKFYLLKIKANSLKVMVPFHSVLNVGLRRVVKNGEIQKIVDFLEDGACDNNADWKYRFKENSERMRTGSLLEVANVLKALLVLNQEKALSFREKKMLERARYLLVSELAMAKNCEEPQVEELLTAALSKSNLRFPDASEFQA